MNLEELGQGRARRDCRWWQDAVALTTKEPPPRIQFLHFPGLIIHYGLQHMNRILEVVWRCLLVRLRFWGCGQVLRSDRQEGRERADWILQAGRLVANWQAWQLGSDTPASALPRAIFALPGVARAPTGLERF